MAADAPIAYDMRGREGVRGVKMGGEMWMGKENVDLLSGLLASRGELLRSLKGVSEATAWTRPEPNEWSVGEILQHLADVDGIQAVRFRQILAGETQLKSVDPADWEGPRSAAAREGLAGVLRRAYASRNEVLELVSNMGPADLEKAGNHPRFGRMTALQLTEMAMNHDLDHAQQIAKTRAVVEA